MRPTKFKKFNKKLWGFDIETYSRKNLFLCGSVISEDGDVGFFKDKDNLLKFIVENCRNSVICASNLSFDFFGMLFGNQNIRYFNLLFRGSSLLCATTYACEGKMSKHSIRGNSEDKLTFIDTMNYVKMSVKELGKLINLDKLPHPSFYPGIPESQKDKAINAYYPMTSQQWDDMKAYNLRDSEISMRAMRFFIDSFQALGANFKITIASTAMSLYKNKYLEQEYFTHDEDVDADIFKAYVGGRTETFYRGRIKGSKLRDVNSLYPSVMMNDYPDPNTLRVRRTGTLELIQKAHGVSFVRIECPYMKYPILPYRAENKKLIFPYGKFSGFYHHVEIRKAIENSYKILSIGKQYYYTNNIFPFKRYVSDLYALRLKYKREGSPMEVVVKLCLNSLYGKFGAKYLEKDTIIFDDLTASELSNYVRVEQLSDDFLRVIENRPKPDYSFPIWAGLVTAYGRCLLWDNIVQHNAFYCDTDSIITLDDFPDSDELGKFKLEHVLDDCILVKPKFYYYSFMKGSDSRQVFKCKGLGTYIDMDIFNAMLAGDTIRYNKFIKFREILRRKENFSINEIIDMSKKFNLSDTKRQWLTDFSKDSLAESKPLLINLA